MQTASSQYAEFRKEFDSVIGYAIKLLNAQAGHKVQNERENYGEKIFGKMVCHAISLQRLFPSLNPGFDKEIWDISSQYALSRAILESYEAFAYIVLGGLSEEELECRILAWKLHAEERRWQMLNLIGSRNPVITMIEKTVGELRSALLEKKYEPYISKDLLGKIKKGDCPDYIIPRSRRLIYGSVDIDYFKAALMQLSSHVHSHPFSLHQLFDFKAGSQEAFNLVKIGGQYACGFLCAAIRDMSELFSSRVPEADVETKRVVDQWCDLLSKGVKNYL